MFSISAVVDRPSKPGAAPVFAANSSTVKAVPLSLEIVEEL
jgi:hypothetical protein